MTTKEKTGKQEIQKSPQAHGLRRFEDLDRLFENFFSRGWLHPFHFERPSLAKMHEPFEGKMPQVDMIDRDGEIVVKAELPGVEKKDLDVSVTKNTVTIKGTTRYEEKEEKGDYYHQEISSGTYMRTLALPADIDENNTKAKFKDGVLELTLTKLEETKRHTVEIE